MIAECFWIASVKENALSLPEFREYLLDNSVAMASV
jgi:hypothetical protein